MKHFYLSFVALWLFGYSAFSQDANKPIRFMLRVDQVASSQGKSCTADGSVEPVMKMWPTIDGEWQGEQCYGQVGKGTWDINSIIIDTWRTKVPDIYMEYFAYEDNKGSKCYYNNSGICPDKKNFDQHGITYSNIINNVNYPPGKWNQIFYQPTNDVSFRWSFKYSPLRPNQPISSAYNICGTESFILSTNDVLPVHNETYVWEESKDKNIWYTISGSSTSTTVKSPDVSAIESRYYRVRSQMNGEQSIVSAITTIWVYPKRPTITSYSHAMPLCNAGSDATITIDKVDGKLGNGVSKYRIYLAKQIGSSWQAVDLINPYITSLPYTFTNARVFDGKLKSGKYQLKLENVVIYPDGADTAFVCSSDLIAFEIKDPPLLVLSSIPLKKGTSNYNISCTGSNDGVIRVTATGGTPLYKFKITSTDLNKETGLLYSTGQSYDFTDLKPNVKYTVLVIDANNCVAQSSQITLTEPIPLSSFVSLNTYSGGYNIKCFGTTDTAYVLVNGGVSPYSVNSGISSVSVTTSGTTGTISGLEGNKLHDFIIKDANGCINNNNITLTQTPSIFTNNYKSTTCNGEGNGSIELSAVGGYTNGGIYTFTLSKNLIPLDTITGTVSYFENLGSGDFNIKIKDKNNCSVDTTVLIPLSAIAPDLKDTVICQGQILTLDVTEEGNTYYWTSTKEYKSVSPILTTSTPAQYNLLITNQYNCTANVKFNLEISDKKFTANFAMPGIGYEGDTIVITEFSWPRPSSMNWTLPNNFELDNQEEGLQYFTLPEEGVYTVKLTAFLGECWDDLEKKITVYDASLNPNNGNNKLGFSGIKNINLYPNPNSGKFTLIVELTDALPIQIDVHDLFTANALDSKNAEGKDTYSFDYNLTLTAGTYNVTVRTSKDKKTFKFVVQ